MKNKFLIAVFLLGAAQVSCDPYKAEVEYIQGELDKLNEQFDLAQASVSALTEIMTAMSDNDFVTSVSVVQEGDRTGYGLIFSKSGKITIWCGRDGKDGKDGRDGRDGEDGEDGKDGADGVTPEVSVRQDTDGVWYWTVNGKWLRDSNGGKVRVAGKDGVVPKLKIEGEYWYISYDNGSTWERVASSVAGDVSLFTAIDYTSYDDYIELTLKDGTVLQIPKNKSLNLNLYNIPEISAGETVSINYSVSGYDGTVEVSALEPEGWKAVVNPTSESSGTITVTAPDPLIFQDILVFASSNGSTTMRPLSFSPKAVDLSAGGSANCYMVHEVGTYSFDVSFKGCGPDLIEGSVSYAEILWQKPAEAGSVLIENLYIGSTGTSYYIKFTTPDAFSKGNALIGLRDQDSQILWSWHIWFTDYDPEEEYCVYKGHDALQMMSCNLGAVSSSVGAKGAEGLFYQWGRKDPFSGTDGASSLSGPVTAGQAAANPLKFITVGDSSSDWNSSPDASLWKAQKPVNDPCPPGWQIPEGELNGIWSDFPASASFDKSSKGILFDKPYSEPASWYPASGAMNPVSVGTDKVGTEGSCWSCTSSGALSMGLHYAESGAVKTSQSTGRAWGRNVRCCRSAGGGEVFPEGDYDDLSAGGTANCYIVPAGGTYKFRADVKGNSKEKLGAAVAGADVIWESFGTDEAPAQGDIIRTVSYKDGYVYFRMASPYRQGNALIAVRDDSGNILWSWHIWACAFNPTTGKALMDGRYVMDRNLGALSRIPGDDLSLGLLYQWGRKEPFMGSSSILDNQKALSTVEWDSKYDASMYCPDYAVSNPTTEIYCNLVRASGDNLCWESDKNKYDPCPPGWKMMDVYIPTSSSSAVWDNYNRGVDVSGLWFPAAGNGSNEVGFYGGYHKSDENSIDANYGYVNHGYSYFSSGNCWQSSTSYTELRSARCVEDNWNIGDETVTVLGASEGANCYIVGAPGLYKFKARYKGNGSETIDTPYTAAILWETDNTSTAVKKGAIVESAETNGCYVYFRVPSPMKEGNALIAVKDRWGNIQWSWHIWVTAYNPDKDSEVFLRHPQYPLMDRNLGALSDKTGEPLANGLVYQWGRKDPFPGAASNMAATTAAVTGESIKYMTSDSGAGYVGYTRYNPATFISVSSAAGGDWLTSRDDALWSTVKTQYDPCPAGWKVPDGGEHGIWSDFSGSSKLLWNASGRGLLFGKAYADPDSWYPAAGYKDGHTGKITSPGDEGVCWSVTSTDDGQSYGFTFNKSAMDYGAVKKGRASACSVRCMKDFGSTSVPLMDFAPSRSEYIVEKGKSVKISCTLYPDNAAVPVFDFSTDNPKVASVSAVGVLTGVSEGSCNITIKAEGRTAKCVCKVMTATDASDLSLNESANCYLVSSAKEYKFKPYKGNGSVTLENVTKAAVLWETLNTSDIPDKGSVVDTAYFKDGYISFITGDEHGNALIAAQDKDGKVLWSWHIWVTDYNPSEDVDTYKSGAKVMDRNLGALSNVPGKVSSFGLFYQWGRKDPFPGSSSISQGVWAATLPSDAFSYTGSGSETGTIEYSITHPSRFILAWNEDWVCTDTYPDTRWGSAKTIYDPCPIGWKVSDGSDEGWAWKGASDYFRSFYESGRGQKWGEFSTPESWYPFTGYIYAWNYYIENIGYFSYFWSCNPKKTLCLVSTNGIGTSSMNRAYGLSVRCVRDE